MTTLRYNRRPAQRAAMAALGLTEKRPTSGNNVSHAMNKTKRLFKPNLQTTKVTIDGKRVSLRLDARTIRSLSKVQKEYTVVKKTPTRAQASATKAKTSAKAKPSAKKPAQK